MSDNVNREEIERIADKICLSVAEIPDRFSPEDQPEMMLVTPAELRVIILQALEDSHEQTIQAVAKLAEALAPFRKQIETVDDSGFGSPFKVSGSRVDWNRLRVVLAQYAALKEAK